MYFVKGEHLAVNSIERRFITVYVLAVVESAGTVGINIRAPLLNNIDAQIISILIIK
jgi:hypothetical protein